MAALCALLAATGVEAEPYLAVQQGLKCGGCHVNPTGGGQRNAYGNLWAQTTMAAQPTTSTEPWTGVINRYVAVGGDLRADARHIDVPNAEQQTEFAMQELRIYLQLSPVPQQVSIHIDQRVAPGGSINREAYARYTGDGGRWYAKAGQMYLPYGLRLQDDAAFVRQLPGINFTTPDRGVEFGWEAARWSTQLAVSNGSFGGPELDTGKQLSLRTVYVQPRWRLGASANFNDAAAGTRTMLNVFGGLRTGPVVWLAQVDRVDDDSLAPAVPTASLLEANWQPRAGHNLKLSLEAMDPDDGREKRRRVSALWEYTPLPFAQLRFGGRSYDGDPLVGIENRTLVFAEVHAFF